MRKGDRFSVFILLIYPIVTSVISLIFKPNFFFSIVLFLIIPSIYLSVRGKKYIKKLLIFSFIASVPIIIIIDYIGQKTLAWSFPLSFFPIKILGVVSVEVILWAFFNMYFILMFYECFLDRHIKPKLWNPHMKYLILFLFILIVPFTLIIFYLPTFINIPYFYLSFGLILFIFPIIWQVFFHPHILSKIFITGVYFFYLSFLYEITALILGWWYFPGAQYVGWIDLFGLSFPVEELVFWIGLFAVSIVSAFEFLDDDQK